MAKQDDAALKLLRWELEGHGEAVLAAMLRHPDKSLADAVEMIEQEIKALSPKDPMSELPMPSVPRGRASSELDALGQEFQTFRHLLQPRRSSDLGGDPQGPRPHPGPGGDGGPPPPPARAVPRGRVLVRARVGPQGIERDRPRHLPEGKGGPREGWRDRVPRRPFRDGADPEGVGAQGQIDLRDAPPGRPPRRDDGRGRLHRGPVPQGAGQGRRLGPHEDGRSDRGEPGGGDEDLREREARGQICGGAPEAPPEDVPLTYSEIARVIWNFPLFRIKA